MGRADCTLWAILKREEMKLKGRYFGGTKKIEGDNEGICLRYIVYIYEIFKELKKRRLRLSTFTHKWETDSWGLISA